MKTILKQTWKTFWNNKKELPLALASDFIFYYLLILLTGYVLNKLMQIAQTLMETYGEIVNPDTMQNAAITAQYGQVTKAIWLFLGGLMLIWTSFKGINWYQAHKMQGTKTNPKDFALKFIITTIFWYALIIILIMISGYSNYAVYTGQIQIISTTALTTITLILIWAALYFGAISYALINEKKAITKAFQQGIKKWKQTIPAYIAATIIWAVSLALVYITIIQNIYATIILTIAIILPAIHYTRLLIINSLKKIG